MNGKNRGSTGCPKFADSGEFSKWVHDQIMAKNPAAIGIEACEAARSHLDISPEYHLARVMLTLHQNHNGVAGIHAKWFGKVGQYVSKKDEGDSLDAFLGALESVLVPYMGSVFETAADEARADQRELPPNIPKRYALLYRLCCALSNDGEHEFFVELDHAAEFLGVDRMTASRWVNALCAVRAIRLVKKAKRDRARRFELDTLPTSSVTPHPQ